MYSRACWFDEWVQSLCAYNVCLEEIHLGDWMLLKRRQRLSYFFQRQFYSSNSWNCQKMRKREAVFLQMSSLDYEWRNDGEIPVDCASALQMVPFGKLTEHEGNMISQLQNTHWLKSPLTAEHVTTCYLKCSPEKDWGGRGFPDGALVICQPLTG